MVESKVIPQLIQNIVQRIIADYQPQKIILFGSYAYGTPDDDSDIDLLIVKETPERFIDRWVTVHRMLRGLHPFVSVEPFVLTPDEIESRLRVGDQFIAEILNKGIVIYAS